MNKFENRENQIEKTAHEWLMVIMSDKATDTDIDAFEVWRNEDPIHRKAYADVSQIWNELGVLARSPQGENLRQSIYEKIETQKYLSNFMDTAKKALSFPQYAFASVIMLLAIAFFIQYTPTQAPEIYQTTTSEIQEITLADNSIITLGAMSHVEVLYTNGQRNVHLKRGQAFFDVTKNPKKPFYVKAKDTVVRVLGTKFDVHLGPQDMTVGVLEGRVQVTPKQTETKPSKAKILLAGQIVSTSSSGFTDNITKAEIKPGAWRKGRLAYKEETFAKIIADANRYYSKHILLEDDSLANIHVTTSFDVTQIDEFLKTLPEMFEVDVIYLRSGDVIIRPLNITKNNQNIALINYQTKERYANSAYSGEN